jgi:hypothetical protein
MGTLCLFELGLVVAFIGFYICDVEAFGARLVWLVRNMDFWYFRIALFLIARASLVVRR